MIVSMQRTQFEVEAQIGSDLTKFYIELFCRGPKSIQVNMLPASAVVVTQNNFTQAENHMMMSGEHQQHMFKDMRDCMIASKLVSLNKIIENASGVVVKCMHHDLTSDEEAFVFSLKAKPEYRLNGPKFCLVKPT